MKWLGVRAPCTPATAPSPHLIFSFFFCLQKNKQREQRNYNRNSHRGCGLMSVSNKYELHCCSNPPTMALCGETAALFCFQKSMNRGLKVTDANSASRSPSFPLKPPVFFLLLLFGPDCMVWALKSSIPPTHTTHLSSSLSSFGNKATCKSTSHFQVWFISYISMWNNIRDEVEKCHFRGENWQHFSKVRVF